MKILATVICLVLAAYPTQAVKLWAADKSESPAPFDKGFKGQGKYDAHHPSDNDWIIGIWRSNKLSYGNFEEWKGTIQIELVASSHDRIGLFLISADGKRSRAGDSQPSIMDESKSLSHKGWNCQFGTQPGVEIPAK